MISQNAKSSPISPTPAQNLQDAKNELDPTRPHPFGWVQVRAEPDGTDPSIGAALRSSQFRHLLEQHVTPVYRFAMQLTKDPHVAEELTQDTMLRGWKQRRQLADPAGIKSWLFTITANLWRDELRRRQVRAKAPQSEPQKDAVQPDEPMVLSEDAKRALSAIDELPRRQRDVLYLTACEGLTPTQIGQVLDISASAAKSTLSLARAKLRERFESELAT